MGCTSSKIYQFRYLSEEDIQNIPQVFRNVKRRRSSPGLKYWFDTCSFQEGTYPVDIKVDFFFILTSSYRERVILLNMRV